MRTSKLINFDKPADLWPSAVCNVQYYRALKLPGNFQSRGRKLRLEARTAVFSLRLLKQRRITALSVRLRKFWPLFLRDLKREGSGTYVAPKASADIRKTPVPRYDLLKGNRYNMFALQTTRGCPHSCEFCDIIITDGRKPRTKTVSQVIAEVDHCVQQGAHYIVFGDANFIGNINFARELLRALADYSRKNDYPFEFSCELTINVAHHPDLLELLQEANFYSVFVGIESPRKQSLTEAGKLQNTREDILEDIKRIQSYHISVVAGMIVGFDSDDRLIFKETYDFLQTLGIPFTTCGTLVALPNTPLLKRLEKEGRLLDLEWTDMNGHGASDCNFIPKQMTSQELRQGYNWLSRCLYRYDSYADRLVTALSRFRNRNKEHKRARLNGNFLWLLLKVFAYYTLTWEKGRIRFFTEPCGVSRPVGRFRWGSGWNSSAGLLPTALSGSIFWRPRGILRQWTRIPLRFQVLRVKFPRNLTSSKKYRSRLASRDGYITFSKTLSLSSFLPQITFVFFFFINIIHHSVNPAGF